MGTFHALPLRPLHDKALDLARTEAHAELTDPATAVFTDLRVAPGVIVPATEGLEETRRLMQLAGVRMAFVVDSTEAVIGLVTLADLQGEQPLLVARHRSAHAHELTALEVMTPVPHWTVIDMRNVQRAQVGHIVATFRAAGQRYLIVIEPADGAASEHGRSVIRGVFSANRVERALGHSIEEELRSRNFAELAAALARE